MYPTFPSADAFAISTAAQEAPVIAFSISHSFSTPAPFNSSTASLRMSVPETFAFIKIIFPLPTVFSHMAGSESINPMAFQSSGIFTDLKWKAFIAAPPTLSSPDTALLSSPNSMPVMLFFSGWPYSSRVSASYNIIKVPPLSA